VPDSKPEAGTRRVGPYTQRRNELAKQYQWKAENILRFLDKLGMTKKQKEKFIADELAQAYMNAEYTYLGLEMLRRTKAR
jgi:hypothetical protein